MAIDHAKYRIKVEWIMMIMQSVYHVYMQVGRQTCYLLVHIPCMNTVNHYIHFVIFIISISFQTILIFFIKTWHAWSRCPVECLISAQNIYVGKNARMLRNIINRTENMGEKYGFSGSMNGFFHWQTQILLTKSGKLQAIFHTTQYWKLPR